MTRLIMAYDALSVAGIYIRPARGISRRLGGRSSSPAERAVEACQGDPEVGEGLRLGVLRLGQSELSVGQVEDGADARVEAALDEAEVFLGGGHGGLGGHDALVRLDHRRARLLDLAGDVELDRLEALL